MTSSGWPVRDSDNSNVGKTVACEVLPANPSPPRYIRLGSVRQIRYQLAEVYRSVRNGEIPSGEGTRLTYMLTQLANMTVDADLADRVEALEKGKGR